MCFAVSEIKCKCFIVPSFIDDESYVAFPLLSQTYGYFCVISLFPLFVRISIGYPSVIHPRYLIDVYLGYPIDIHQ